MKMKVLKGFFTNAQKAQIVHSLWVDKAKEVISVCTLVVGFGITFGPGSRNLLLIFPPFKSIAIELGVFIFNIIKFGPRVSSPEVGVCVAVLITQVLSSLTDQQVFP